jgi:hypothetical protein
MPKFVNEPLNLKYEIIGATDRNVILSNPVRYEGPISKIPAEEVAEQLVKDGLLKKKKEPKTPKPVPAPATEEAK